MQLTGPHEDQAVKPHGRIGLFHCSNQLILHLKSRHSNIQIFKQTANTNAWGIFGSTCCGMHSDLGIEVDLAYDALDCESLKIWVASKVRKVQALPAESWQPVISCSTCKATHFCLWTFTATSDLRRIDIAREASYVHHCKGNCRQAKKTCLRPHLFVQLRYAGWHHCDQVVGIRSLLQLTMLRTGSSRFSFLFSIRN